jgi:hypothetical protein
MEWEAPSTFGVFVYKQKKNSLFLPYRWSFSVVQEAFHEEGMLPIFPECVASKMECQNEKLSMSVLALSYHMHASEAARETQLDNPQIT